MYVILEGGVEIFGFCSFVYGFVIWCYGLVLVEANGANRIIRKFADRKRSRCMLLCFEFNVF